MGGGGNILEVKFLPGNTIFPGMLFQTSYQTWECFNIPKHSRKIKRFPHIKSPLKVYGIDFGWGRSRKVYATFVDRVGAFSLFEFRNTDGGVEIAQELESF